MHCTEIMNSLWDKEQRSLQTGAPLMHMEQ